LKTFEKSDCVVVKCVGSEYARAKCVVFENKVKKCVVMYYDEDYINLYIKEFYLNRELHRENGPAIEYLNEPKRNKYYLNGVKYNEKQYKMNLRKLKIRRLKSS
jgi:uncharacterized membrane protein